MAPLVTLPALLLWRPGKTRRKKEGKTVAYISQHAPRAIPPLPGTGGPSQGHRAPPDPRQDSTAGHQHRWSLFVPQQGLSSPPLHTPEIGVRSSVFTEIVAKSLKRRRGSSVFTPPGRGRSGRSSRNSPEPGGFQVCLPHSAYFYRNFIYSLLCGPIRQISPYL